MLRVTADQVSERDTRLWSTTAKNSPFKNAFKKQ